MHKFENGMDNKLACFLIGAGIGAATALLFAPKAGSELRTDISGAAKRGLDQAREKSRELSDRANAAYQTGVEQASDLALRAKESVSELAERGKEAIHRQASPLVAAVEAGKEGYLEAKRADEVKSLAASA